MPHMPTRRDCLSLLALPALSAALLPGRAQAQAPAPAYTQPLRIVLPFAPGGPTDMMARAISKSMSQTLGQPVVVDNKPGGGGLVAFAEVQRAPADGYTLAFPSILAVTNPALMPKYPYETLRDFTPVTVVGFIPHVLAVRTDHPAKSLADLVATARAKPDSVTYASSGNGTSAHLAAALLASEAKVSMLHVPYKGAGPALTDLLSGQVECMSLDTNSALPQIRAGKLRALAAAPRRRIALLPDVPTVAEQGYPNFDVHGWYGLLARAGTPEPMVNLLHNAVRIALATPEVREQFRGAAVDACGMPPAPYREIIRNDLVKWNTLVDRLQIKLD